MYEVPYALFPMYFQKVVNGDEAFGLANSRGMPSLSHCGVPQSRHLARQICESPICCPSLPWGL